jgi:formylmethanofuran dehydrogenase subunit E
LVKIKQMNSTVEELLEECKGLHGHICPGQVLGVRMALLGCSLIGIDDPRGSDRKKIIVWVEIDRCLTDAVSVVTGVRLGKRSLKYLDFGKVAATFLNTDSMLAVRIVALDESRLLADKHFGEIESKKERQMRFYKAAQQEELFRVEPVSIVLKDLERPGHSRVRIACARCGEGVNDGKEVVSADGTKLCKPCAFGTYYQRLQA